MKKLVLLFCLIGFTAVSQTKPAAKPQTKPKKEVKSETEVTKANLPDRKASFVGGSEAMDKFIISNLKTPEKFKTDTAIKTNTVFLRFMIEKTGKVSNVEVVKGIKKCKECSEEAVRVVNMMPSWNAAIENGQMIDSWYNLPVNFQKK